MDLNGQKCPACGRNFDHDDDIVVCPVCGKPAKSMVVWGIAY